MEEHSLVGDRLPEISKKKKCVLQNVYKDSCFGQGQSAVWVMVAYAVLRCYGCNCIAVRNHDDVQFQIQGPGMARIPY